MAMVTAGPRGPARPAGDRDIAAPTGAGGTGPKQVRPAADARYTAAGPSGAEETGCSGDEAVGACAPPRRLRRDAEANRRQILQAAGRLMAERGLATPLEDIAAAAGVGIGTLYRRFPTRQALVEALFEDRLAAYLADLQTALAMPNGWYALLWFLRTAARRQIADRALSELIEHDAGTDAIRQLVRQLWPLAETLVERAKATGQLRPDFTATDLAFLQQMLVAVGTATNPHSDTAWQRYLTVLVDGMVAARTQPTTAPVPALTMDELEELHALEPAATTRHRPPRPGTCPS